MSIHVKRDTGMMGGATKVALEVDNKVVKKLGNNEEYTISSDGKQVTMKAKQWFLGSKESKVDRGNTVSIKINNLAVTLYFIFLLVMLLGASIHPIVSFIGMAGFVITIIYSLNNWFKLEVNSK